ncbi:MULTISPECIES: hypothetical protein [unclassified Streptomyces]|uniref:hypothetical protein n=1 Tax=unclassified Streptomyces TaxID=2593676 RepID=UPI0033BC1A97
MVPALSVAAGSEPGLVVAPGAAGCGAWTRVEPAAAGPGLLTVSRTAPVPMADVVTAGASWVSRAVALRGAGADIARLSGVTRIHRSSAGAAPAAEGSGRRPGQASAVASEAALWAGGRVSAGRGPGRVPAACGVSRFVMVVPPR